MDITQLFWLFFILSALQPVMRQRMLEAARVRAIARLEKERKSRVIMMVHRQETMSLLGFPLMRFIDVQDSEEILRAIHLTDKDVPIDLVLHTPGGLVLASVQIARALKKHPAPVRVIVPHYAMSGGTLISLAADEIIMAEHAVLGPVDPQLGQAPAASILRAIERKPVEKVDDQTLIMADQARMAIDQVRAVVRELVSGRMDDSQADELARKLSEGIWTHDFPINAQMAKDLGLNVSTDIPAEIMEVMALYPQPVRHSGVEYLPGRRVTEHK
ncbi:ATP-dependent Clp protease proteolytic subunit [Hahella sp. SMD15-11]|uniref:ATP-dependent Clp protease proteolytic subunit n=1 Tax=Thermohahella caldifontis TaxID=3142973 RepID=A0AB39UW65_9GAMM